MVSGRVCAGPGGSVCGLRHAAFCFGFVLWFWRGLSFGQAHIQWWYLPVRGPVRGRQSRREDARGEAPERTTGPPDASRTTDWTWIH